MSSRKRLDVGAVGAVRRKGSWPKVELARITPCCRHHGGGREKVEGTAEKVPGAKESGEEMEVHAQDSRYEDKRKCQIGPLVNSPFCVLLTLSFFVMVCDFR